VFDMRLIAETTYTYLNVTLLSVQYACC